MGGVVYYVSKSYKDSGNFSDVAECGEAGGVDGGGYGEEECGEGVGMRPVPLIYIYIYVVQGMGWDQGLKRAR